MKSFNQLASGEVKNLTEEEIEIYSLDVGEELLDNLVVRRTIAKQIGRGRIERQIKKLKEIHKDLTGE